MIRCLRLILDDLRQGKNLDLYSTIIVSIAVAALGVAEAVSFQVVSAAILATLSLLAASLLASRRVTAELQREIQKAGRASGILLEKYPDLSNEFRLASRINILGTSLSSTVGRYYADLEKALGRGCRLRILVVDPTPEILPLLAYKSYWANEPEVLKGHLSALRSRVRELSKASREPELLELRRVPYIPPCGMVLLERDDGASKIYVKVMSFRSKKTARFEVNDQKDGHWYRFFFDQFEQLWNAPTCIDVE